jgi:hypothetical protein
VFLRCVVVYCHYLCLCKMVPNERRLRIGQMVLQSLNPSAPPLDQFQSRGIPERVALESKQGGAQHLPTGLERFSEPQNRDGDSSHGKSLIRESALPRPQTLLRERDREQATPPAPPTMPLTLSLAATPSLLSQRSQDTNPWSLSPSTRSIRPAPAIDNNQRDNDQYRGRFTTGREKPPNELARETPGSVTSTKPHIGGHRPVGVVWQIEGEQPRSRSFTPNKRSPRVEEKEKSNETEMSNIRDEGGRDLVDRNGADKVRSQSANRNRPVSRSAGRPKLSNFAQVGHVTVKLFL